MAHHEETLRLLALLPARQPSQYVSAQNLVGSIALGILHGAAVCGRVEQDILVAKYLHHIMVEITSSLFVVEQNQKGGCTFQFLGQRREEQGRARPFAAFQIYRRGTAAMHHFGEGLHRRMEGIRGE